MTNKLRKVTALMLSFMLVFVSVFGSGSFVYAGGVEDGEFGSGKEVVEEGGTLDIDTEGINEYYPASFKYAVRNMRLTVSFTDGTSETVTYWQANNGGYDGNDYAFTANGNSSHDQYFMRFYHVDAGVSTQMKIGDSEVPIGTFTVFITRNEEENPIEVVLIRILDPVTQNPSGNKATFTTSDYRTFEETWYPLDLNDGKEYVFNANSSTTSYFSGIWYKDSIDGSVYNLDVGMSAEMNEKSFNYTDEAGETAYLVIGETYGSTSQTVTMSWQEKKELKSIELKPATSYQPWKHDIETMPLKLTYADGTTATEGNWMQESFDATGNYDYVEGYAMTTTNGDTIYMAKYDGGTWQIADRYVSFTPGSFNWRAFVADNRNIRDDATVKIADPSPATLKLEDGYYADFSVSESKSAAYVYTPAKAERLQIINNGQNDMIAYTYFQPEGTNMWQYQQGELVFNKRPATIQLQAGWKYMTILSSEEGSTTGSIGVYSVGSTKSATVPSKTIQQDDFGAWAKLPITFNFTNPEGVSVGSQTISNWDGNSGYDNTGYAETRYGEAVYYQVYKDGKQVAVPFISEEMMAVLNDQTDDEVKNYILMECGFYGGVAGLKLATGTYTVKVYLNYVAANNLIGTGTVKVAEPGCTTHSWNSGKVTKAATCTATGTKTYTCTKCGGTKKETIKKKSHTIVTVKGKAATCTATGLTEGKQCSVCKTVTTAQKTIAKKEHDYSTKWTVDKAATTKANGSKSKHCKNCSAKKRKTTIYKLKTVKLKTASFVYNGKQKTPTVVVTNSKGKAIDKSNYTVTTPKGRKAVGKYTYKITFKNEYKGIKAKTLTLTIKPKTPTTKKPAALKKGFTAKWNTLPKTQASGYEVMYATNAKFTKNKKTVKVTSFKTKTKKVTKLKAKTKYWVKVRAYKTVKVNGKSTKIYSGWSKAKTITTKK